MNKKVSMDGCHTYSKEQLVHFQCFNCSKWWTIGDYIPVFGGEITCPWCGQLAFYMMNEGEPTAEEKLMDNSDAIDRGPARDYYIVTTIGEVKFLGWHLPEREKTNWHYYECIEPSPSILHFRKEHMVSVVESINDKD